MNPKPVDAITISRTIRMSRRAAAQAAGLGLAAVSLAPVLRASAQEATPAAGATPVTGEAIPGLDGFDAAMSQLVADWGLPGAQLAIAVEGRLVFDRGYGFADVEAGEAVRPDHRFRIASVSKTITAIGALRLIDAGQLTLDTPVFPLLDLEPFPNAPIDQRMDAITVEQLMIHAGGWNSGASGDPQYVPLLELAASVAGETGPPDATTIIRLMLGSGLDYDPGTASIYSNFGLNVLGRVIEKVSGQTYDAFIREQVFASAGIESTQLGKTRLDERAEGEVRYYQPPEYPATVPSVFPGEGFVPFAYGSFFMDVMDSHGGWIARASDLVRFALAIDGQRGEALLQPETVAAMISAPRPPGQGLNGAATGDPAAGLVWVVQDGPLGREWAHTGALGGSTAAMLVRNDEGLTLAFLANTLPADVVGFFDALRPALIGAAAAIETWPDIDLF